MRLIMFSKNLKYLMDQRGLDKWQLQSCLRLKSVSRIEAWLGGYSFPKKELLIDLCDALDYYDIYKMITIDLKKGKIQIKRQNLPSGVSAVLENIIDQAQAALTGTKKPRL
jgi:hypothetical protein